MLAITVASLGIKKFFLTPRMASKSGAESDGKCLRKNWSDDSMLAAMEAVRTSKMSISVAANRFKVPRKTLDDRLKGRVQHGTHPGVSTSLLFRKRIHS